MDPKKRGPEGFYGIALSLILLGLMSIGRDPFCFEQKRGPKRIDLSQDVTLNPLQGECGGKR